MFPSSFYGVKQHTDSKRNPSIAHDEPNGGLTIKPFYAKWVQILKNLILIIFFIYMYGTGQDSGRDFRLDEEVTKI